MGIPVLIRVSRNGITWNFKKGSTFQLKGRFHKTDLRLRSHIDGKDKENTTYL